MNESYLLQLHHPNCFADWNFTVYTSIDQHTSYEKKKIDTSTEKIQHSNLQSNKSWQYWYAIQ